MKATVRDNHITPEQVRTLNYLAQVREGVSPELESPRLSQSPIVTGQSDREVKGWDSGKLAREQEIRARVTTAEFRPFDYLNPGFGGFRIIRIEVR